MEYPAKLNKESWESYIQYRAEQKMRKLKEMSIKRVTEWLANYEMDTQADIVETTIRNGWIGLFPPKNIGRKHEAHSRIDNSAVARVHRATAAILEPESGCEIMADYD